MSKAVINLELSRNVGIPMYQQIKNAIIDKIKTKEWQPGHMIPSENQLAVEFDVSRMTITRPLRELTAEGLLKRAHGVGTFVAEPPRQASLIELRSIAEEIKLQGKSHRAEVLSQVSILAKGQVLDRMNLVKDCNLFHVVLVHYQDDIPIQLESRYVNPSMAPDFIHADFNKITPSDYLISQIRPDNIEHVVQAIMPDSFMAAHLAIASDEPCLKLKRRTWVNDVIVTAADMIYPSSRYNLGAHYLP